MKRLSKMFLAVLLLTAASVSWAACPEGTKNNYKGECVPVAASETTGDSKWPISCGLVDEEAYRVEGSKHIFKLDNGDIGRCSTDSKGYKDAYLEFDHSERQEVKSKKVYNKGQYKFSALVTISGASQWRSTILQFHDSGKKGAPPSWFGFDGDWWFRTSDKRGMKKNLRITLGQPFQLEAIFWFPNEKTLSVDYFIDGELIAQHHNRKMNKGSYVKFGIYRVLSEGTTTFIYDNPVIEKLD